MAKEQSTQEPIYVTTIRWHPLVPFAFFLGFELFWVWANVFGPATTPGVFFVQPLSYDFVFAAILIIFAVPTFYFFRLFFCAKKTLFFEESASAELQFPIGKMTYIPYSKLAMSPLMTRISLLRWRKSYKYFELSIRDTKKSWEVDDKYMMQAGSTLFNWLRERKFHVEN